MPLVWCQESLKKIRHKDNHLSRCMVGKKRETAPGHTLQAEMPAHSRLACFHVSCRKSADERCADPKIFSLRQSPLPWVYRKFYPHPHSITVAFIPIPTGIPLLLSPLLWLPWYYCCPHPHVTL